MLPEKLNAAIQLDPSIRIRGYTPADLDGIYAVIVEMNLEINGSNNSSRDDLVTEYATPGFDPAQAVAVAETLDGQIVGYVQVWAHTNPPLHPYVIGWTKREFRGRGIGTALSLWGLARATEIVLPQVPDGARVSALYPADSVTPDAAELFTNLGMTRTNSFFSMEITLTDKVPAAALPEGITIKDLNDFGGNIVPFVQGHMDTFRDHRGFVDTPLEERLERWKHNVASAPKFDNRLWFLAMDGDKPAGVIVGWPDSETDAEMGYIQIVGVYPEYRRMGLGLALLHHTFALYKRLGVKKVGLDVDGHSLTGATRLYERAGMHISARRDVYEALIRDGEELTPQ